MISYLALLLLLTLNAPFLNAQPRENPEQRPVVFTHVAVIDAAGALIKQDMTVVIVGNYIAEVGKGAEVKVPKSAQVFDSRGKFLMPGLWDMHVHIFNQFSRRPPNIWYFPLFVANGVTSVREMWTKPENMPQVRQWRRLVAEGGLIGPRVAAVGTIVDGPAGAETTNSAAALPGPTVDVVSTPEEARQFVRNVKAAGIDFIKTYSSLSRETYFAIADEAKKQSIPFAGHVPFAVDPGEASSAGQQSMEHLDQILESSSSRSRELLQVPGKDWSSKYDELTLDTFDEARFKRLVATLAKNQSWQVPTLVRKRVHAFRGETVITNDSRLGYVPGNELADWKKYFSPHEKASEKAIAHRLWEKQHEIVHPMHQAGVPFLAGTDLGGDYIFPGFSLHDELALFVQVGLTPGEALKTATYNPAKFLGMLDRLGAVEKGKLADLVLLDANPLEDIHNTQKIRAVVLNGKYLDRTALDKLLADSAFSARTH
jgi:cytosine/adenosine deaminase-related metal-dependent hydrolase